MDRSGKERGSVDAEAVDALAIGEVAKTYGVSIDQLRNWDNMGILPARRIGATRIYYGEDLANLDSIKGLLARGFRPKDIRILLEMDSLLGQTSVSANQLLRDALLQATRGDTVKEPLPNRRVYNSAYRRLERAAKATGRKVIIKTSEDKKSLEAKVVE